VPFYQPWRGLQYLLEKPRLENEEREVNVKGELTNI
jgi:hypothetical protein